MPRHQAGLQHQRDRGRAIDEQLQPGEVLVIPPAEQLGRDYPGLCPRQAPRSAAASQMLPVSDPRQSLGGRGMYYVVEEGDTLFDIARYELGKASRWVEIYDLNRDPIVSPYTGKSYPRSYFESTVLSKLEEEEEVAEKELDAEDEAPEIVSLEEADDEAKGGSDDIPDLGDDDVEIDDEDDDTFLPDEEEEDDDVADIIGVGGEDDDEI